MKLMIDSAHHSFAEEHSLQRGLCERLRDQDDTERAKLWDIQDQTTANAFEGCTPHGKKIVDVKHFMAKPMRLLSVKLQPASRWMCQMLREMLGSSMAQIAESRIRSALHESRPHLLDGLNGGLKTTISEDSPTSEAPLHSLDVEVLPPPGEICESRSTASARIAPIAMDDERVEEGSRVELAGLVRDVGLNGRRGICMGRAPDGERWLIPLLGGRRVNVKMSNIKPAGDLDTEIVQREDTSAVPLRGPEDPPSRAMIEAHNLTHLPAAPWCEICVQARGKVIGKHKSSTTVRFRVCRWISSSSPVSLYGVPRHRPWQLC